jgi:hypothetical protein
MKTNLGGQTACIGQTSVFVFDRGDLAFGQGHSEVGIGESVVQSRMNCEVRVIPLESCLWAVWARSGMVEEGGGSYLETKPQVHQPLEMRGSRMTPTQT